MTDFYIYEHNKGFELDFTHRISTRWIEQRQASGSLIYLAVLKCPLIEDNFALRQQLHLLFFFFWYKDECVGMYATMLSKH